MDSKLIHFQKFASNRRQINQIFVYVCHPFLNKDKLSDKMFYARLPAFSLLQ